jgi:antitoxin (DNA-binding transcriptional repressor) of toxin-antitoxin stability system
MNLITIHKAKTELSKLIERAISGEEVVIAKGKVPMVKLTPLDSAKKKPRKPGAWKGMITFNEGWDADLTAEELGHWEDATIEPAR